MAKYDNLSTSELSRITRERGLDKPEVLNAGEWSAWLRERDTDTPTWPKHAAASDYDSLTMAELRELADKRNINTDSAKRKADIIALLQQVFE